MMGKPLNKGCLITNIRNNMIITWYLYYIDFQAGGRGGWDWEGTFLLEKNKTEKNIKLGVLKGCFFGFADPNPTTGLYRKSSNVRR